MNTHKMRLVTKAFDNMKSGIKKIEIRLNDRKRQLINIGDEIIFEEVSETPRFMKVKVLNLIYAKSFEELIESNEDISIFYDKKISKDDLISLYYTFYTKEEENKYGVLGIEVKVIEEGFISAERFSSLTTEGKLLSMTDITPFRQEIIDEMLKIPYGQVVTYNDISKTIAKKRGLERMSAQASRWSSRMKSYLYHYTLP